MNYKIIATMSLIISTMFFSGCSLKNPFGIGYDTSVCESSKDFGVCGAPKDIYKYRDDIRKVQNNYLNARLDTVLFFGVDKEGNILVKDDRDGQWERYDISKWKKIIDEALGNNKEILAEQDKLSNKLNEDLGIAKNTSVSKPNSKERLARVSYGNDIPVTEGNDLSIAYKAQGALINTRSQIGDIIRDNGLIQQAFIANYVDYGGDLISSHEVYIVIKDAEWIVGEKTPKSSKIEELPTPISTEMLKKQNIVEKYQEKVVDKFNIGDKAGLIEAVTEDPENNVQEEKINSDIIKSFIK